MQTRRKGRPRQRPMTSERRRRPRPAFTATRGLAAALVLITGCASPDPAADPSGAPAPAGSVARGTFLEGGSAPGGAADRVRPNDNREPAGKMRDGVLELGLEARVAMWHPDGEDLPGAPVPAFAEEGGAPRIPGPLVRVTAGTQAEISVRNTLGDTLLLHGLHTRAASGAEAAPIAIAPGERRTVRFLLDAPGTYHYWGTTMGRAINFRTLEDAQLTGAIVVDDPADGAHRDRVLVIGMWTDTVHRALVHRERVLGVINGRSWPATERLHHTVGDTVRWRVINASADLHPMHLHGFYFRVDSRGDGLTDARHIAGTGDMAVTESLLPGGTMSLTWIPERPGNWLFHCHIPEHIGPRGSLGLTRPAEPMSGGGTHDAHVHSDHARSGMSGLVLGVEVRPGQPRDLVDATDTGARRIRLLVRQNLGSSAGRPFYGYALHEGGAEPPLDSGLTAAPTLDLTRGEPVRITIVNRLTEPTAVHWHGIELDSYFDGVPGFSGVDGRVAPIVLPGDSFEVRFTPPRAGTFIYHTHADEERQQLAGLAGALIVTEPGAPRDPVTDIPILLSAPTDRADHLRSALINGEAAPAPIEMRVGTSYRLRLIQMSAVRSALRVELWRDSTQSTWRRVAKDGADLPLPERAQQPARVFLGIGEVYDVQVTPEAVGTMRLEVRSGPPWPALSVVIATLPIRVGPAEESRAPSVTRPRARPLRHPTPRGARGRSSPHAPPRFVR